MSNWREQVDKLIDAEDLPGVERYLIDHFNELPENLQGKLLVGWFEESAEKERGKVAIAKLQEEGLAALDKLEEIKQELSKPE